MFVRYLLKKLNVSEGGSDPSTAEIDFRKIHLEWNGETLNPECQLCEVITVDSYIYYVIPFYSVHIPSTPSLFNSPNLIILKMGSQFQIWMGAWVVFKTLVLNFSIKIEPNHLYICR